MGAKLFPQRKDSLEKNNIKIMGDAAKKDSSDCIIYDQEKLIQIIPSDILLYCAQHYFTEVL